MASTKDYLDFVLDQLSDLEDIRFRQMMGGYITRNSVFAKAAQKIKNKQ